MTDHSDCEEEEGIVDLEATLEEISSIHKVINKQAKTLFLLHSQLEEDKIREVELLKVAQDKEEELARAKEKTGTSQKTVKPPTYSPAYDTNKYLTNEE